MDNKLFLHVLDLLNNIRNTYMHAMCTFLLKCVSEFHMLYISFFLICSPTGENTLTFIKEMLAYFPTARHTLRVKYVSISNVILTKKVQVYTCNLFCFLLTNVCWAECLNETKKSVFFH